MRDLCKESLKLKPRTTKLRWRNFSFPPASTTKALTMALDIRDLLYDRYPDEVSEIGRREVRDEILRVSANVITWGCLCTLVRNISFKSEYDFSNLLERVGQDCGKDKI
jgi:hypothetical protein